MIGWAEGLMDIISVFPLLKQCLGSHQIAPKGQGLEIITSIRLHFLLFVVRKLGMLTK